VRTEGVLAGRDGVQSQVVSQVAMRQNLASHVTCGERAPGYATRPGGDLANSVLVGPRFGPRRSERYLGCKQPIRCAVNDSIGIGPTN